MPTTKQQHHQIRNLGYEGRTCLDSPAAKKNLKKAVGLYPCHNQGGNQVITQNKKNFLADLRLVLATRSDEGN